MIVNYCWCWHTKLWAPHSGPQILKYLLSGPLRIKFRDPGLYTVFFLFFSYCLFVLQTGSLFDGISPIWDLALCSLMVSFDLLLCSLCFLGTPAGVSFPRTMGSQPLQLGPRSPVSLELAKSAMISSHGLEYLRVLPPPCREHLVMGAEGASYSVIKFKILAYRAGDRIWFQFCRKKTTQACTHAHMHVLPTNPTPIIVYLY